MKIFDVRVNGLINPIGYDFPFLSISWKIEDSKGKKQKDSLIEVSQKEDFGEILYQKQGVLSSCGEEIIIQLLPRQRYYYRITVIADNGEIATSDTCYFETGKMNEHLEGEWISPDKKEIAPIFFRSFALEKKVKKARLYLSGVGLFEGYCNGKKIGQETLLPLLADKNQSQIITFDIGDMLTAENTLEIMVGSGWVKGRFGLSHAAHSEIEFAIWGELVIEDIEGNITKILTDDKWFWKESPVVFDGIYDGETQDYTVNNNNYYAVKRTDTPFELIDRISPPVFAHDCLGVKEILHTKKDEYVLDFGQNLAGYVLCHRLMEKGEKMTLEFGEIMQDGCFYHDNYRTAKSIFTYISDGQRRDIVPHFTFFGFRYVKVTGFVPTPMDFSAWAVYSDCTATGTFDCSNEKINKLHSNTLWGLKSNFLDMPTDCPQRDERLGWCGDAQVFCKTASYLKDTRAFYLKFLNLLRKDQLRNGGKIAYYLPNEYANRYAAVWSDIGTFLPKMLLDTYGDIASIRELYPMMRDYVRKIRADDMARGEQNLWNFGFQFGDWLALDGATEQSSFGRTDEYFISSCYYYASALYTAQIAKVLGNGEEKEFFELSEKIKNAIFREYYTPSGRLALDTQTAYLVALKFGLYPNKSKIIEGLQKAFKRDLYKIRGGFVGATMMNTVLGDNGLSELAYDFLLNEDYPGWLFEINLGATTIWERWNSLLPDGTCSGTGMNSFNHYAYGSVVEFLYRNMAGIKEGARGFEKIILQPLVDPRIDYVNCTYLSAMGKIESHWKINNPHELTFKFVVPFGTTAKIILPEKEPVEVEAGVYEYTYTTEKEYKYTITPFTPLKKIFAVPEAKDIVLKYLPFLAGIKDDDVEGMSKSLEDRRTFFISCGWNVDMFENLYKELTNISIK